MTDGEWRTEKPLIPAKIEIAFTLREASTLGILSNAAIYAAANPDWSDFWIDETVFATNPRRLAAIRRVMKKVDKAIAGETDIF